MPVIERALRVGLQRKHRRDLLAAQDRDPDKGAGNPALVGGRAGNEDRGALAHRPDLALELLAFERAGPRRLADQDRLAGLVGLAGRAGHGERNRGDDLLDAAHVLVALGHRSLRGLRDRREDEAVEAQKCRQLLAQGAHDRPAVEARGKAPADRVDDLEPPALVLDRLIAARVAHGEGDLVRNQLQEGRRRVFVCVGARALDAERAPRHAALFEGYPERGVRMVDQHGLVVGHDAARRCRQGRTRREPPRAGRRLALHGQVAGSVGPVLQRDHLERIHREQLAQGGVEPGEHAGLVQGCGHGPRDAVQGLQAASLVASQLVERGVRQQDAEPAVHVFQELQLAGGNPTLAVGVVDHAADELALVLHRHPDRHLAADPHARALADLEASVRFDRNHGAFRVRELAHVHRLTHRSPSYVLEHAGVHGERVVPAFTLEDLQVDGVVAELPLQAAVEDLEEVRLGHAGAQLMDEGVDRRAGAPSHALPGNRGRASRRALDPGR